MTIKLLQGDCIEVMRTLEAESVDAIVTDPPYGLEFMGKDWDRFKPTDAHAQARRLRSAELGEESKRRYIASGTKRNSVRNANTGGASRYFPCFRYNAKASSRERLLPNGERSSHPTVKPLSLMEWLVQLVTPPNGLVLDPFCGSGTTLLAAKRQGFNALGVELSEEYCTIIRARLGLCDNEPSAPSLQLFGG